MKKNYITPLTESMAFATARLMDENVSSSLPGGGSKTDGNPPGAPGRRVF